MAATACQRKRLITGDITRLQVEPIATAANEDLVGCHGVDRRRAGGTGCQPQVE